MGDLIKAAVLLIVGGEYHGKLLGVGIHRDQHILQRVAGVEIEGEEQAATGKAHGLLRCLHQHLIGHPLTENVIFLGGLDHILVKVAQPLILQENNIGNHVTIYRTSWEYEDGKSFYSNEEFEVFMQQEIQDQIDFWVNEMNYTQEEAEKEIFRERVVTISYRG